MTSLFPKSFGFFLATGAVFALQWFPIPGFFLMFVLAMFWSVLLINAGMIGTALEAASGRVSRWWLILPIAFYGAYEAFAWKDHQELRSLANFYGKANAGVKMPFDPVQQSLVIVNDDYMGAWLTQNYALPVVYQTRTDRLTGYSSYRLVDAATCSQIRAFSSGVPHLNISGVYDGKRRQLSNEDKRFCGVSLPERPSRPEVRIAREFRSRFGGALSVNPVVTSIVMPDGKSFQLYSGYATPLAWIPMPIMGCGLISSVAKWKCEVSFWRNTSTPIVSANGHGNQEGEILARALGLRFVAIADRKGSDPSSLLKEIGGFKE